MAHAFPSQSRPDPGSNGSLPYQQGPGEVDTIVSLLVGIDGLGSHLLGPGTVDRPSGDDIENRSDEHIPPPDDRLERYRSPSGNGGTR